MILLSLIVDPFKKCDLQPQRLKNAEFFIKANLPETCCSMSFASQSAFFSVAKKNTNDLTLYS